MICLGVYFGLFCALSFSNLWVSSFCQIWEVFSNSSQQYFFESFLSRVLSFFFLGLQDMNTRSFVTVPQVPDYLVIIFSFIFSISIIQEYQFFSHSPPFCCIIYIEVFTPVMSFSYKISIWFFLNVLFIF